MTTLEEKLGYTFQNTALLENALTHSSCANESRGKLQSNERLEFLGDSILGMVVADHLYRNHPDLPEGELTRTRAALVCEESLVEVAQALGLGEYLKLGKGEEAGGGRERPSIIADAVEAVLAAVYLDGGIGSARKLIQKFILDREAEKSASRDYKTPFRSWCSGRAARCWATSSSAPRALITPRSSRWRWISTASPSARAAAAVKKRRSRTRPRLR